MINKLISVLERLDQRVSRIEDCLVKQVPLINNAINAMSGPDGHVVLSGAIKSDPTAIRRAFDNPVRFDMECVEVEARFSSAVYLALSPNAKEKIKRLLDDAAVAQLVETLELHKRLEALTGGLEKRVKAFERKIEKNLEEVEIKMTRAIASAAKVEIDRLAELRKIIAGKEEDISKAVRVAREALSDTQAMKTQLGNDLASVSSAGAGGMRSRRR